jgi:hypothetical protein
MLTPPARKGKLPDGKAGRTMAVKNPFQNNPKTRFCKGEETDKDEARDQAEQLQAV